MCASVLADDILSCAPLRHSSHSDLPRGGKAVCSFPLHAALQWSLSELAGYGSYVGSRSMVLESLSPHSQQTLCFLNFCTSSTCLTSSLKKITLKPH